MAVWSSLGRALSGSKILTNFLNGRLVSKNVSLVRNMSSHQRMPIIPSRWAYHKFKDMLHFYVMLGVIPLGLLVSYCNVFIGPAQLAPIPEGYEPKEWEYYSHPITRFFKKYIMTSDQQEYEKYCHKLHEEYDKAELKRIENKVRELMSERRDYQSWYYVPVTSKYHKVAQQDQLEAVTERMTPGYHAK